MVEDEKLKTFSGRPDISNFGSSEPAIFLWAFVPFFESLPRSRLELSATNLLPVRRVGFLINFTFPDKTQHEIHWRNNGNVWIKVIGQSNRTTIQELRQAASGLFTLSLDN